MRDLNLALADGEEPLYLRLAESVRQAIEEGQLEPGELLPSTRQLARRFSTHRHTVMNALAELVAEGWLDSEPGRGYRVVPGLPRYFCPSPSALPSDLSQPPSFDYAFPSGQPDLRLFPTADYYRAVREAMREVDPVELLGYDEPAGRLSLRHELTHYLRRLRAITGQAVVVTHGSQEGIFLLGQMLVQPGQVVAVEEMGYSPTFEALRLTGAQLRPVQIDGEGLVLESLERLARTTPVALVYVTPLHQYPTTVTMGNERRHQLYEVAHRHGIKILEDDYDHEFHYRSRPLAPLKSREPEQIVYYTSTFSKVVYPSARLGFVALPPKRAQEVTRLKRITTRQNSSLLQEAMARWMSSGGFERHLRRMRRVYSERRLIMASSLGD